MHALWHASIACITSLRNNIEQQSISANRMQDQLPPPMHCGAAPLLHALLQTMQRVQHLARKGCGVCERHCHRAASLFYSSMSKK
jgi:hypothetical protein